MTEAKQRNSARMENLNLRRPAVHGASHDRRIGRRKQSEVPMPTMSSVPMIGFPSCWWTQTTDYTQDVFQRSVLFADIIRRRGNQYLEHLRQGQPPVLTFDYEVLLDGCKMDPPTNYYLARIHDRRSSSGAHPADLEERRRNAFSEKGSVPKRPLIIIDPRAGHGPGIGGSKQDSEIGMALDQGISVYVILFRTWPVAGQTLEHVQQAMARFVEAVRARHPQAGNPAVIGNCQAGWAAALLGAVRPDITGPIVLNGAPLSYWAGVKGKNPMRYKGGLAGGVWAASLWGDLGNGMFDGAHLVAGFEDLNPAHTYWDKQYHLWANVDTEADRYLAFERWWNGYFMLTAEEIHFIVDQLFVGNRAQQGQLLMNGQTVDLKSLKGPLVVFASHGDNITPPQQALNWIPAQWGSVDEICRRGQTIVYMVHDTIGHLGIFVSAGVSKKEHREIIASIDLIEYLAPGLYEMIISDEDADGLRQVRFEPRQMADILALDDGSEDEAAFVPADALSRFNDSAYRLLARPWVKGWMTEATAEALRQLHPLRISRYGFSDLNPWMGLVKHAADTVKKQRQPVAGDNPFSTLEKIASSAVSNGLNLYRDLRDWALESWFYTVFDNPWVRAFSADGSVEDQAAPLECRPEWLDRIDAGDFAEAVVRIMVILTDAGGGGARRRNLSAFRSLVDQDKRLKHLEGEALSEAIRRQSCIVTCEPEGALGALPRMLPDRTDRKKALSIAADLLIDTTPADPRWIKVHVALADLLEDAPH